MNPRKWLLKTMTSTLVLLLPLIWLYFHAQLGTSKRAHELESLLLEIMQVDTELTEKILKSRSQLTLHYDDIAIYQRRLNSLIKQFTPELTNNVMALKFDLNLVAKLSEKSQISVERFKSINAQVSQRQRYIKLLASEIKYSIKENNSQRIINQIDEIVIEVFNARIFGHQFNYSDAKRHMNSLSLAVTNSNGRTQELVANFNLHLKKLLLLETTEIQVLDTILKHQMRNKVQSIRRRLIDSQYQMVNDNNQTQRYLLIYASILLMLVIFFMLNRRYLKKHASMHKKISERDHLTNLYNRRRFLQQLEEIINTQSGALLFIDLDGFKLINDQLGHHVGDETLKLVAYRLESLITKHESMNFSSEVFRLGGDEFVILVDELCEETRLEVLKSFSKRVVNSCYFTLDNPHHDYQLSVSVGVALFPEQGTNVANVLNCADKAMYHSKQHGRNRFTLYDSLSL